jgi:hypothetical protein
LATALNFICKFYDSNFRGEQKTKERTFQITTNLFFSNLAVTVVVSFVADYGRTHCQAATNFMRATKVEFATAPAIKFTTCYMPGFYHV